MLKSFTILLLLSSMRTHPVKSIVLSHQAKIPKEPLKNETYMVGIQGQPFEVNCIAGESDIDHPTWVFTRDIWERTPQDESTINHGYDSEATGRYMTTLHFNRVRLDDYGLYECLSESKQVLRKFFLYVQSKKSLLLPVEQSILRINAGGAAIIPCRVLNPTDPNIKVKLIRQMTGENLVNTVYLGPTEGFEIQKALLPDHDGVVECQAESGSLVDKIQFILSLNLASDGPIISPPQDCKQCFELTKPHIQLEGENEEDIHEGDNVELKCMLTIPSSMKGQIELSWLTFKLGPSLGQFNTTTLAINESNGYIELVALNHIKNITSPGPFKCASRSKDEYGTTLEQLYTAITFKLVQFKEGKNKTIEWHKDTFNEVIHVDEMEAVKWVIGFTIHSRERVDVNTPPNFKLSRRDGALVRFSNETKKDTYHRNRFVLTLHLEQCTIEDMGEYELEIFNTDDGVAFKPHLPMSLYVNGKPKVKIEGNNPSGFYHSGQDYNITASIWSYPINETSIEIFFTNCTNEEMKACTPENAKMYNERVSLEPSSIGGPWVAKSDGLDIVHHETTPGRRNGYSESFYIKVHGGDHSGFLVSKACRNSGSYCSEEIVPLFVTDLPTSNGTFFDSSATSVVEGDAVSFTCAASKVMYSNVTWGHSSGASIIEDDGAEVHFWETDFSYWTNISVEQSTQKNSGSFICIALSESKQMTARFSRSLQVRRVQPPTITGNNNTQVIKLGENFTLSCGYDIKGDPTPAIVWSKDGNPIESVVVGPNEKDEYFEYRAELAYFGSNSEHRFLATKCFPEGSRKVQKRTLGRCQSTIMASIEGYYVCTASNRGGSTSIFTKVEYQVEVPRTHVIWGGTIAGIVVICIIIFFALCSYHRWKLGREKLKYKKILETFHMGDPKGLMELKKEILLNHGIPLNDVNLDECGSLINEDMGQFQQPKNAHMLPYDAKKWEIPYERLTFQEPLGEGQFGVVKKAKLDQKSGGGQKVTVAVKMLKPTPSLSEIKNLMSEIKIMIHLGRNENIVNVLGACTTQLERQELYVVVEYCEHGSILEVLRGHKQAFRRKTLKMQRELSRASLKPTSTKPRTTSTSSGHFNFNGSIKEEDEDEGSKEENSEDPYSSLRRLSSPGRRDVLSDVEAVYYRSMNKRSPASAHIRQRTETIRESITLTINKLISWSEQIANGMDYLSSKNVVHGDLACRNILLARDNVVKISDFGLAKYVEYKDYYKNEKKQVPLPMKWLSLETLETGKYTCLSDVWSYGVVLWEIFSLGETPYPEVPIQEIRDRVINGLRLGRPEHILDPIYDLMISCQHPDPELRPRFSNLVAMMRAIGNDFRFGRIATPLPAQPRSAFANSLYFNSDSSSVVSGPTSARPEEGQDGYLIPSTPQIPPNYYLKLEQKHFNPNYHENATEPEAGV